MTPQEPTPLLDAQALRALARGQPGQCGCALKGCQGWESISDERWPAQQMRKAGSLRPELPEGQSELTFEEFHPHGTRYASADAPIAPAYFPFNRCDVYSCSRCQCAVLRYTEYGGYYVDHRVRLVDARLIVDPESL